MITKILSRPDIWIVVFVLGVVLTGKAQQVEHKNSIKLELFSSTSFYGKNIHAVIGETCTQYISHQDNSMKEGFLQRFTEKKDNKSAKILTDFAQEQSNFQVYPNPSNQFISISAPSDHTIGKVQILNSQGQLVIEQKHVILDQKINVETLQAGFYYVKIIARDITSIPPFKIIKL